MQKCYTKNISSVFSIVTRTIKIDSLFFGLNDEIQTIGGKIWWKKKSNEKIESAFR